ncbi:MAG: ATP-binding protein, partial [Bacteroidia bacterium]
AWHENASGNRVATYTNLPYGDYTFRVRCRISNGVWSNAVLEIPVHIQTPFWATSWFLIAVVLLSVLVLAIAIRYFAQRRLRQRLRALEVANKIQEEKERISRDLHDNVGAQLTYIISSLDHVAFRLEKEGDLNPARKKVNDLSEYSRLTMQQLRESIWAINSESIKLSEMLARLQEHLQLLSENNEDMEVSSERTGQDQLLPPARSIEVFRILQEGISNAFKHAQATQLMLLIADEGEQIRFQLTDNGKGFDTQLNKIGHYGLKNMRQRAERSGIVFALDSQLGKGTVLTLVLNKE